MKNFHPIFFLFCLFSSVSPVSLMAAEESLQSVAPESQSRDTGSVTPPVAAPPIKKKPPRLLRKIVHDRETEGTKAPNHFDTDPVIKSRYELNGQPLEVDTD